MLTSRPAFAVAQLLGIFPFEHQSTTGEIKRSVVLSGLSVFWSSIILYALFDRLTNSLNVEANKTTEFFNSIINSLAVIYVCYSWICPLFIGDIFKRIWLLRAEITSSAIKFRFHLTFRYHRREGLGLLTALGVVLGLPVVDIFFSMPVGRYSLSYYVCTYVPLVICIIAQCNLDYWLCFIKHNLKTIQHNLKYEVSSYYVLWGHDTMQTYHDLAAQYLRLFELSQNVNSLFGAHLLYFYIYGFVDCTIYIFSLIQTVLPLSEIETFGPSYAWIVFHVCQLLIISLQVEGIIMEATRLQKTLSINWKTIDSRDYRTVNKLFWLASLLDQFPISIIPGGCFRVRCSILPQFAAAVFTNAMFFAQGDQVRKLKL